MATETLKINDGTTMEIARLPDVDDATWAELKAYVEGNPETAKTLQNFAKNPEAVPPPWSLGFFMLFLLLFLPQGGGFPLHKQPPKIGKPYQPSN